jgi:predicted metal-dependent peptidase
MNDNVAKLMIKARTKLLMDATFYGSISMGLKLREDHNAFKLWTDGETLGYNPDIVEQMPRNILISAIGELVLHIAHKHHLRMDNRNPDIWNQACDNVVMDIMRMSGKFTIPPEYNAEDVTRFRGMNTEAIYKILYDEAPKDPDPDGDGEGEGESNSEQDQENSGGGDDGGKEQEQEQEQEQEENSDSGGDEQKPPESDQDDRGDGNNEKDSDQDSENRHESSSQENKQDNGLDENHDNSGKENGSDSPQDGAGENKKQDQKPQSGQGEVRTPQLPSGQESPTESELKQMEQNLERDITQAEAVAKNMGQGTFELERLIKDLRAPVLPWTELLERFVERAAKNDYSWSVPNHRYMHLGVILPSMRSNEVGTAIFVVDSSGSVTQEELKLFASEISHVLDAYQNFEVDVMYCADELDPHIDHFTHQDFPITLNPHVWGGTSFAPPFEYIRENLQDPTFLVYFTDMGSNRYPDFTPRYPVLWINTSKSLYYGEPPFGELIYMDNRS